MSELGKPDLAEIFTDTELNHFIAAMDRSGYPHGVEEYKTVVNWAMRIRIEYAIMLAVLQGRKAIFVKEGEVMLTANQPEHR